VLLDGELQIVRRLPLGERKDFVFVRAFSRFSGAFRPDCWPAVAAHRRPLQFDWPMPIA
jgi:hypothetical protein